MKPNPFTHSKEIPVPEATVMDPEKVLATPTNKQQASWTSSSEIYDSGCTWHMVLDCHRLTNYQAIPLKPINAANQESFSAIKEGEMTIHTLNGSTSMKIKLQNVLYVPNMRNTLILISQINQVGYSVAFQDRKCVICNPKDCIVAQIPKSHGLHQVKPDPVYALSAETLTLNELH